MEFLGNILPFIIFVLLAINKTKKTAQKNKPAEKGTLAPETYPRPVEQKMRKPAIGKDFKSIGEMLRREINTAIDEMMEGKKISRHNKGQLHKTERELENETAAEQYIGAEKEKFRKVIETPGAQIKGEIGDHIYKDEIGSKHTPIRKQELVRGIILSEVLGKPKVLKR
ncbi:hypothetical protein SAMN02745975_02151 [Geosporobacter subterraneus DSM 17957]|uniref:Uncharacterized protein n=1 Tax=Geosporobacter subterraneus DSM 17957 TaxID=1121919 RepID=A0A1M6JIN5_9FIRM|nr:hypothetical protein [Geosporobacter subterraneus]SHJ46561.1 hypothetical protein SAMN02745975_02151 [Geosporobacter subterraneus DSM 17957]